jgi:hypothetical protein
MGKFVHTSIRDLLATLHTLLRINQMTYAQILNFVFESGRITTDATKDPEGYKSEVKNEVAFEAGERKESGELEGTIEGAVEFALEHIG